MLTHVLEALAAVLPDEEDPAVADAPVPEWYTSAA